jgi:hypothetical protein
MTRFWSEEKPVETENDLFRVKVVGSIPAGPTTLLHVVCSWKSGIVFCYILKGRLVVEDVGLKHKG